MAAPLDIPPDTTSALLKALAGDLEEAVELSKKGLAENPQSEQAIAVNLVISQRLTGRKALLEDLQRLHFPLKDFGAVATVLDGVEVGYAVYGEGATESGKFCEKWESLKENAKIVLFFHGLPGSRLFFTPSMTSTCVENGCTVILLERPSYGLSSDIHKFTDGIWNELVSEFLSVLGLGDKKIFLVAYSGGCPYALSLGVGVAARHFSSIAIVSCPSPPIAGATDNLAVTSKLGYFFARNSSWLLEKCLVRESSKMVKDPIHFFYHDYMGGLSSGDAAAYLYNEHIEKAFVFSVYEMYASDFAKGVRAETKNYEYICNDWPFSLKDIALPVHIWYGEEDCPNLVVAGSKYLSTEIPSSQLFPVSGEGHLILFTHWPQILSHSLSPSSLG